MSADRDSIFGELIALDVRSVGATGPRELWRWPAPTADPLFTGAVTADALYAVSGDHNVYRIDRTSGAGEVVLTTRGALGSEPTVAGGVLSVPSEDRHIYAVDLSSRDVLWTEKVPGSPTTPVVAGGRLIVGTDLGQLIMLTEGPRRFRTPPRWGRAVGRTRQPNCRSLPAHHVKRRGGGQGVDRRDGARDRDSRWPPALMVTGPCTSASGGGQAESLGQQALVP